MFIEASGSVLQTKVSAPKGLRGFGVFLQAVISNCVRAPHFRQGATTPEEYQASLRCDDAVKHGILSGRRISFTLPVEVIQAVDDPLPITQFWDDAIDLFEDLVHRAHVETHNLLHVVSEQQEGVEHLRRDPYVIGIKETLACRSVPLLTVTLVTVPLVAVPVVAVEHVRRDSYVIGIKETLACRPVKRTL